MTPVSLDPASDDGPQDANMTGAMDGIPFEEVFSVHERTRQTLPIGSDSQDECTAYALTAYDLHIQASNTYAFPRTSAPERVRKQDLLQPGDFVIARIWSGDRVPIIIISSEEQQRTPSDSLLVLRPLKPLSPSEEFFYLRYICSNYLLGGITCRDNLAIIPPEILKRQRIPKPDSATLNAITELTSAAESFGTWKRDADDAVHSFFQWPDPTTARAHMIESGRLTRQRREAASAVNEVGSRLRATLPYPIARRWREVQAARPDEAGYKLVLECAEAAIAYCAVLGLVFAREAQISLHRVHALRRRVRQGNMAQMTFGIWLNILREVATAATEQDIPSDSPLTRFRCFTDADMASAVRELYERRNHKSHGRGPAAHEINDAVQNSRRHLKTILSGVEWLVDYPLRHIDACHWDSFINTSQITYRELMGDHNIVSPTDEHTTQILETGSPYIADSYGRYRLLRPFLLTQHCPHCGQLSLFILDQWNANTQEIEYLALDHPDTITVTDMRAPLQHVGFL
ncbi:hypothetical protein [Saccharopolyspora sp. NPDC002578]